MERKEHIKFSLGTIGVCMLEAGLLHIFKSGMPAFCITVGAIGLILLLWDLMFKNIQKIRG